MKSKNTWAKILNAFDATQERATVLSMLLVWLYIYIAIISMLPLVGMGFYNIAIALEHYFVDHDTTNCLTELLHAIEFFFMAPLPVIIIFSFKKYILSVFASVGEPNDNKAPNNSENIEIKPEEAEKVFISSLIGVTSTFIIGKIIKVFSNFDPVNNKHKVPSDPLSDKQIIIFAIALIFLIIQIILLKIVSKHLREKE